MKTIGEQFERLEAVTDPRLAKAARMSQRAAEQGACWRNMEFTGFAFSSVMLGKGAYAIQVDRLDTREIETIGYLTAA